LTTVYAIQAALAQEVAGQHPASKISAWTPYMTVHSHFKHCSSLIDYCFFIAALSFNIAEVCRMVYSVLYVQN